MLYYHFKYNRIFSFLGLDYHIAIQSNENVRDFTVSLKVTMYSM